jgi:hypothetical protein
MWSPPNNKPDNLRGAQRKRVPLSAMACDDLGQQIQDCTLRDMSESGARIGFARMARPLETLFLINIRERIVHHARLIWHNGFEAGVAFNGTTPLASIVDPSLGFLRKLWMERTAR